MEKSSSSGKFASNFRRKEVKIFPFRSTCWGPLKAQQIHKENERKSSEEIRWKSENKKKEKTRVECELPNRDVKINRISCFLGAETFSLLVDGLSHISPSNSKYSSSRSRWKVRKSSAWKLIRLRVKMRKIEKTKDSESRRMEGKSFSLRSWNNIQTHLAHIIFNKFSLRFRLPPLPSIYVSSGGDEWCYVCDIIYRYASHCREPFFDSWCNVKLSERKM